MCHYLYLLNHGWWTQTMRQEEKGSLVSPPLQSAWRKGPHSRKTKQNKTDLHPVIRSGGWALVAAWTGLPHVDTPPVFASVRAQWVSTSVGTPLPAGCSATCPRIPDTMTFKYNYKKSFDWNINASHCHVGLLLGYTSSLAELNNDFVCA